MTISEICLQLREFLVLVIYIHDLEIISGSSGDVISRTPTLNEQNKCDNENNELEGVKDIDSVNQRDPFVTRSGRRVKPCVKLDL